MKSTSAILDLSIFTMKMYCGGIQTCQLWTNCEQQCPQSLCPTLHIAHYHGMFGTQFLLPKAYCLFFRVLWQFWKQLFVFECVKEPTYSPTAQVPHRKHPLRQLKTRAVLCGWLVPCYTWGWQSCSVGSVANCSRRAPFLILSRKIYRKDQS
jgi:hypothetical protein